MASVVYNGTKMIIPRYIVSISERVNVSYSEIIPQFTVIQTAWAWLRKVDNGTESYWKNTVGPFDCCNDPFAPTNSQFDFDLMVFSGAMGSVKRIDWNKEKGTMRIESRRQHPVPLIRILGLRKIRRI